MKIITNKKSLTDVDIQTLLQSHEVSRILKLKAYYEGRHSVLRKQGRRHDAPNNKLVSNFPAYITNMSTGFFIGQPITYKSDVAHEKDLQILLEIFKYNDEAAHNLDLAQEASITGSAYEILYIDSDAQIRLASLPSEEIILVCDSTLTQDILCAIRHFKIYDLNGVSYEEFADVYTDKVVKHYSYNGALKKLGEEEHYFNDVPIVEYPNNKQRRGDFEDVLTLIDAYNMTQSLSLDDLMDFTDAFLILRGVGGTTAEDIKELRREKTIILGEGGGAEWLIKNLNDAYIENLKNRLQTDIHKFSNVPDLSDENFASNSSGVAIKYKLIGLEQIRSRKEREFKKALQRRIELISNILKLQNRAQIDFRDISMQFTANIPANVQEAAQVVNSLDGLVSKQTLLGLLPFIEDTAAELEKIQQEDNFDEHIH